MEQERYQVRFDWGAAGARAVGAGADVLVQVDAVRSPAADDPWIDVPAEAVVRADFRTATAVARWIVDLQQRLQQRVSIAVVAAGSTRSDGSLRTNLEDLLAAGAVIRALGEQGIDATSPEAAAAEGAYLSLRPAVGHLLSASVTAATDQVPRDLARVDPELDGSAVEIVRDHPRR